MDPMVGSGSGSKSISIGLRHSPEEDNNSNSNVSLLERCFLCNCRFFHQSVDLGSTNGNLNLKEEDILEAFLEENGGEREKSLLQCCPPCKSLCKNLLQTKEALSTLIEEISTLLRRSKKIPAKYLLSKPRVINRLFQEQSLNTISFFPSSIINQTEFTKEENVNHPVANLFPPSNSNFLDQYEIHLIPEGQEQSTDTENSTSGNSSSNKSTPEKNFELVEVLAANLKTPSKVKPKPKRQLSQQTLSPGSSSSINLSPEFSTGTLMITNSSGRFVLVKEQFENLEENARDCDNNEGSDNNEDIDVDIIGLPPVGNGQAIEILVKTAPIVPKSTENTEQVPKTSKHVCKICSKTFKSGRDLKNHEKGRHSQEKPFICEICGTGYRQKKALEVHVALHRGESRFECELCHKVFTQKAGLQRHLPLHSKTGDTKFQCDLCGKGFLHHSSFAHHKLTHSGEKKFICKTCDQSFFSSSHLKRHIRTHTLEKPFKCEVCQRSFNENFNLKCHMRVHTKIPAHQCPDCDMGFNRKNKLNLHLLTVHNKDSDCNSMKHEAEVM